MWGRLAALLVATGIGALAASDSQAQAPLPTCTGAAAIKVSFPSKVAWGRQAVVSGTTEAEGTLASRTTLSAFSAVRGGTLRETFFGRFGTSSDGDREWRFRLHKGDPPAILATRWTERVVNDDQDFLCDRVLAARTVGYPGEPPEVVPSRRYAEGGGLDLEVGLGECSLAAPGNVRVTISTRGSSKTAVLSDQCNGRWNRARQYGRGFRLKNVGADSITDQQVRFRDVSRRTGLHLYRYKVTLGKKVVASRRFAVKVRYSRGYRIYQETDDFVNVCINDNRIVYSSGGRLYCNEPAYAARKLRLLGR